MHGRVQKRWCSSRIQRYGIMQYIIHRGFSLLDISQMGTFPFRNKKLWLAEAEGHSLILMKTHAGLWETLFSRNCQLKRLSVEKVIGWNVWKEQLQKRDETKGSHVSLVMFIVLNSKLPDFLLFRVNLSQSYQRLHDPRWVLYRVPEEVCPKIYFLGELLNKLLYSVLRIRIESRNGGPVLNWLASWIRILTIY